ncbi:RNA polymerase sigma factor [Sorangium sp. KYC3313]|uniref:RNA polymerase sigma factor n=1 Tax=Sorangium sp. KYC3313 TaxID=3449740 RepID=UPI003F897249
METILITTLPGRDSERPPARAHRAIVTLDIDAITRHKAIIDGVLRRWSVPSKDRADVAQEVLLGAWQSMRAGRFQPRPEVPIAVALKRWLIGITWRHASHYVTRAWRRYEVLVPDACRLFQDHARSPLGQMEAREALRELGRVRPRFRAVLALKAQGYTCREIGAALGHNPNTVWNRVRLGRLWLRRAKARQDGASLRTSPEHDLHRDKHGHF